MKKLRVAMVAGETSGDALGANLIQALQKRITQLETYGIVGSQMIAAGATEWYPMDKLSVMGFFEILTAIPSIYKMRQEFYHRLLADPPDLFIGIDAPDFNLGLEILLRKANIPVVHYVCPTIWAWRAWRWRKIVKAVNLLLAILPFEVDYFKQYAIPTVFVGHPLADKIPLQSDKVAARQQLKISSSKKIIALFPGSRLQELKYHAEIVIRTALWCQEKYPHLQFIVSLTNDKCREYFTMKLNAIAPQFQILQVYQQASLVMTAADVVLAKSGTTTLECALVKRPMVVFYRLSNLSYKMGIHLMKVKYFALANIIAGKELVPEFIQDAATPKNLGAALLKFLDDKELTEQLHKEFTKIHHALKCDSGEIAANAIMRLLNNG